MPKLLIVGDPKGTHSLAAINAGWSPLDITVVEFDRRHVYAIKCIDARLDIIFDDHSLTKLNDLAMDFNLTIGNPPYGNRGALAVKFVNKGLELSGRVDMVLPLSFTKPSIQNSIDPYARLLLSEELPLNTFPNGIRAVRQVWVKTDTKRELIPLPTTHEDFEFVKWEDRDTADLMIGAVGSGPSGKVFTENFSHYQRKHSFIKCKSQEVIDRLVEMGPDLRALSKAQNGRGGVCKSDIVRMYISKYES